MEPDLIAALEDLSAAVGEVLEAWESAPLPESSCSRTWVEVGEWQGPNPLDLD